jgi:hypothetical protein
VKALSVNSSIERMRASLDFMENGMFVAFIALRQVLSDQRAPRALINICHLIGREEPSAGKL